MTEFVADTILRAVSNAISSNKKKNKKEAIGKKKLTLKKSCLLVTELDETHWQRIRKKL